MNRYLLRTENGWLRIIYDKVKTIPDHITDDDIWYGRVSFDDI